MNSLRDKKILKAFGENLKKIRQSKNISQQKLGLEADSFQSTIIRIEQGKSDLKLSTLFAVAKALNINPKKLLEFSIT